MQGSERKVKELREKKKYCHTHNGLVCAAVFARC